MVPLSQTDYIGVKKNSTLQKYLYSTAKKGKENDYYFFVCACMIKIYRESLQSF